MHMLNSYCGIDRDPRSIDGHEAVVTALRRRDGDGASQAMRNHIDQIVALDQFWRQRARHEEVFRIIRVAHTDVAIGVNDVLVGKNAIGNNEVTQQIVQLAHNGVSFSKIFSIGPGHHP